jgi:hypothetical protein
MDKTTFTILSLLEKKDQPGLSPTVRDASDRPDSPVLRTVSGPCGEAEAAGGPAEYEETLPVERSAGNVEVNTDVSALLEGFYKRRGQRRNNYWSVFSEIQQTTF